MKRKNVLILFWILVWIGIAEFWIVYGMITTDAINLGNLVYSFLVSSGISAVMTMVMLFEWYVMSPFEHPFGGV
jgi:hypothetical protein